MGGAKAPSIAAGAQPVGSLVSSSASIQLWKRLRAAPSVISTRARLPLISRTLVRSVLRGWMARNRSRRPSR